MEAVIYEPDGGRVDMLAEGVLIDPDQLSMRFVQTTWYTTWSSWDERHTFREVKTQTGSRSVTQT